MNLDTYREQAEAFTSALDLEYYLHFSGQRDSYDIEPIYERHAELFSREAVDGLRTLGAPSALLEFAVHGLIGRETKGLEAELARREAALEVEVEGERMPFRAAAVAQANAASSERRVAIEAARDEVTVSELNPLHLELLERSHQIAGELGWASMLELCEELSGIDLRSLSRETDAFLDASAGAYEEVVEPQLQQHLGFGFDTLVRADLSAFFRAPSLDAHFPGEQLVSSLVETLDGMGIDIEGQSGVKLDTEHRPLKSPRAFCAPVKVPGEIYLVIARIGGRDDYAALFHEAGHTEHFAHADARLPVEARYFGDNSVTEGFAFLFEHLVASPEWLRRRLHLEDPGEVVAHATAFKLIFLRRYSAKLAYEIDLHDAPASMEALQDVYRRRMSDAVGVDWPGAQWLSDVDPFFYVSRYLRAWALETHLRRMLVERFGPAWFEEPEAGEQLQALWRRGQRDGADELLEELTGATLDFSALAEELAAR